MDRNNVKHLAGHRQAVLNGISYMALDMSEEELKRRREYIRRELKGTSLNAVGNEIIDQILVYADADGITIQDPEGYNYYSPRDGTFRMVAEERIERSMIPPEYIRLFSNDFDWNVYGEDTRQQSRIIMKFIYDFKEFAIEGMGLYIQSGTRGSGKTMLACIVLNEIGSKYGINTKFINVMDYLAITKKSYNGNREEIDMIRRASLLVVDDIGTQMSREWVDSTFYELVNYRYSNKLPTIFTSNSPVEALDMDERITDRIERKTLVVPMPEKSIRKIKGSSEKLGFMKKMGLVSVKKTY